jgi:hypothetical protein
MFSSDRDKGALLKRNARSFSKTKSQKKKKKRERERVLIKPKMTGTLPIHARP